MEERKRRRLYIKILKLWKSTEMPMVLLRNTKIYAFFFSWEYAKF